MNVLVLGGTGNISLSIVGLLLREGHEVTCFNRGLSGESVPPEVRRLQGDRRDRDAFESLMRGRSFDAAIDMISYTADDAASAVRAFAGGVGHYVHCSTTCTYGIEFAGYPVREEHPLRPITPYGRGKAEAEAVLTDAYERDGIPVTILRPSTTYGPKMGLLRQIAREFSWIDRIRRGKPIVVCGDGNALHQFLHVDDAARAFVGVIGRSRCIGQTYNLVNRGCVTWNEYHRTAMRVIGRETELVGVPFRELMRADAQRFAICRDIFGHHCYYDAEKLIGDVPEFRPAVSLEDGMRGVLERMDREGRIPDSDGERWEDGLIRAQNSVWEGYGQWPNDKSASA